MFKKILALLLALLLASFAFAACKEEEPTFVDDPEKPGSSLENEEASLLKSGTIGDSALTWEMYSDGVLYIKGTGAMDELEKGEGDSVIQPWYEYCDNQSGTSITTLVVEGGVTSLASKAFMNCRKLKEVRIASSISIIPEKCFKYCEALTTVSAKGVVRIEDNAFDSCVKLSTVTFSASLELVGDGAFLRVGEDAKTFSVRLAGTPEEWNAAKAAMDADENDECDIWTGNEKLIAGLESVAFVNKE